MAMLLKMMDFKNYWCFFLGGFVLVGYLNLNQTAVSLIALVIAVAIYKLGNRKKESDEFDDEFEDDEELNEEELVDDDELADEELEDDVEEVDEEPTDDEAWDDDTSDTNEES